MHACGHDVHTSSAPDNGQYNQSSQRRIRRNHKVYFPARPKKVFPGGASLMIKEGIFREPKT